MKSSARPAHLLTILHGQCEGLMENGDYHGLNEVTPSLNAAVPDMLKLQTAVEGCHKVCTMNWYCFLSLPGSRLQAATEGKTLLLSLCVNDLQ